MVLIINTHTRGTPRTHACMCTHTRVTFRPESRKLRDDQKVAFSVVKGLEMVNRKREREEDEEVDVSSLTCTSPAKKVRGVVLQVFSDEEREDGK